MNPADRGVQESRRPTLYGSRQAISSGHYLASAAGFAILEAGGNAIDAGCGAGIALAVLCTQEVNFAGVAPIMIRTGTGDGAAGHGRSAPGEVVTLDGLGHWPASIPADLFMREHGAMIPFGILQTIVPAAPDAWITALRDYGTMSFGEVAGAAIRYAREGFAAYDYMCDEISGNSDRYRHWPSSAEIYLPGGMPPQFGERFIQSDLAATLQYMADEEQSAARRPAGTRGSGAGRAGGADGDDAASTGAASGHDAASTSRASGHDAARLAGLEAARAAFYEGDIAAAITKFHTDNGGYLTREDLANFHSSYEPAVKVRWRDIDLYTAGPWCQGPVVAQTLLMAERAGLADMSWDSPGYVHLMLELLKGAFADREYHYGDPRFVDVEIDRLLSDKHISARVAAVDHERAAAELPNPIGDPRMIARAKELLPPPTSDDLERSWVDTSYVCVVDRWGNSFSAVPSDGSSGSPVIPGTGIIPSERGLQSRPDPRHPSGVAPGKRPRLTPNPAMAVGDDGSFLVFGCPGGDMQCQAMVQVFLNHFHFGMDIQEAINAPRFSTWSFPNSFAPFEYLANRVRIESRFGPETEAELKHRGHDVEMWPAFTRDAASVEAILFDAETGFLRAGADPRQPAYAIAN